MHAALAADAFNPEEPPVKVALVPENGRMAARELRPRKQKARRASSGKTGGVKPFGAPAAGLPQEVKNLTPAETAEYLRNRIDAPAANTEGDTPEEKVIRRTTRRWLRRRAEKASFLSTRSS